MIPNAAVSVVLVAAMSYQNISQQLFRACCNGLRRHKQYKAPSTATETNPSTVAKLSLEFPQPAISSRVLFVLESFQQPGAFTACLAVTVTIVLSS